MIEEYLKAEHYDLVTPDGYITDIQRLSPDKAEATVLIENIAPIFVGFSIDPIHIIFNIKSTLAQLGLDASAKEIFLEPDKRRAIVKVQLWTVVKIARNLLSGITVGSYIGKLFVKDPRRLVRDPDYLSRMFGRSDRWGDPLLSLGGLQGSKNLVLEKIDGRTVAYLSLQEGRVVYDSDIYTIMNTVSMALPDNNLPLRNLIRLHQFVMPELPHMVGEGELLLVKTLPLHVRTVFAKVVDELLPTGYHHTSASVLQPDTQASGDIYELYGTSPKELNDIPLEFYTLEPYREYVYFSDKDQLQTALEDSSVLFKAFSTAPPPQDERAATFIVKSSQLLNLSADDWISRPTHFHELPGQKHGVRHMLMVERYIEQQPCYPLLKAMDDGVITSQGILLTRFFSSPFMKRMLLSNQVQRLLRGIYFQHPSRNFHNAFSAEDRALLHDLEKFAIPVFWVDNDTGKILQYAQKPDHETGLFVPLDKVNTFLNSTVFGIYGSNLIAEVFEQELRQLLTGIMAMRNEVNHPLLNKDTPLSLVTGGGPGVMELGNRIAKEVGFLSCANIVDFSQQKDFLLFEQRQNKFVEAKMTYRLDKLVERQAEFHLDFPIFVIGGIGTDFEYCLEEVRRKVGATKPTPILLCGMEEYWKEKITSRFRCNLQSGSIKGSEWITNCFYCIQSAEQGLAVYRQFFTGKLPIGPAGPIYEKGFCVPQLC